MARRIYVLAVSAGMALAAGVMALGSMTAATRQADSAWNLVPPAAGVLADSAWNLVPPDPSADPTLSPMDSAWN
ncbi:hypothetical protein [Saccharothrix sp. ST-888]|uniref:hypothetical protein n=1 Tax=Saccharothrix sp. ST-888 TaxID=1427391 RepID=UPI000AA1564A|nr:hypothetical protein [Saccharothrix sp. ST-888]